MTDLYGSRVRALDARPHGVSPCPVCRASTACDRFAVEGVAAPVVVCEGCGVGRFEPMLAPAEVAEFYPDDYYGEPGLKFHPLVERAVRWIGARHVRFLSLGLPPGSRVLDVGCGRGVVLGALADRGLEVHGVEMSAAAARGADPRAEVRHRRDLAEAGYPELALRPGADLARARARRAAARDARRGAGGSCGRAVGSWSAVPNFASRQARWSGAAWFHLDLPRISTVPARGAAHGCSTRPASSRSPITTSRCARTRSAGCRAR
jgi:SAM-dependent methyltransferase